VNQCYKHFYYFVSELNLIERKELEPLVSRLVQVLPYTARWPVADPDFELRGGPGFV